MKKINSIRKVRGAKNLNPLWCRDSSKARSVLTFSIIVTYLYSDTLSHLRSVRLYTHLQYMTKSWRLITIS